MSNELHPVSIQNHLEITIVTEARYKSVGLLSTAETPVNKSLKKEGICEWDIRIPWMETS